MNSRIKQIPEWTENEIEAKKLDGFPYTLCKKSKITK